MRSSLRCLMVVVLVAMMGAVLLPGGASACNRRCANIAPPGQTPCLRCIDDPSVSADCRNTSGSCGCIFVQCLASFSIDSETTALASIFSSGPEPAPCTGLPAEITVTAE